MRGTGGKSPGMSTTTKLLSTTDSKSVAYIPASHDNLGSRTIKNHSPPNGNHEKSPAPETHHPIRQIFLDSDVASNDVKTRAAQ